MRLSPDLAAEEPETRLSNLIAKLKRFLPWFAFQRWSQPVPPAEGLRLPFSRLQCPLETQLWRGEDPAWQRRLSEDLLSRRGETEGFRSGLSLVADILPIRSCIQSLRTAKQLKNKLSSFQYIGRIYKQHS